MIQRRTVLLGVLLTLVGTVSQAQGTLRYLSSLDGPASDSLSVASDSWYAARVVAGTNPGGYSLDAVTVSLAAPFGSAEGLRVLLYDADDMGFPGNILASLSGPDPSTAGAFGFSASSQLVLTPSTPYFIALTSSTPLAQGFYHWNVANTTDYLSLEGWGIALSYRHSVDGFEWSRDRSAPFQIGVDATAVPEPSTFWLALLGLGLLAAGRWGRRTAGPSG